MRCVYTAVLLIFYLSAASGEECQRNGARCPDYTVIQTYEEYEERSYPSMVWVSASQNGMSKVDVTRGLIKQLYGYLRGANDRGEELRMMVPVRTAKVVHDGYNSYTMSVALEPSQSTNPPQPLNPEVTVAREPATTYVARSFGGQARPDNIWDHHAEILMTATGNDAAVNNTFYYICVYDSPWREENRLNEVWMVKNLTSA